MVWFQQCLQFTNGGDTEVLACGMRCKTVMFDLSVVQLHT